MASNKKGDAKEEIMEPRSTSVWEVGITFPLFPNVKSRALLYIDEIVTIIQPCRNPHQTNAVRAQNPCKEWLSYLTGHCNVNFLLVVFKYLSQQLLTG